MLNKLALISLHIYCKPLQDKEAEDQLATFTHPILETTDTKQFVAKLPLEGERRASDRESESAEM